MNTQSKMTYIEGSIYKITSDQTDDIYIGSTEETLEIRLMNHKSDYKRWLDGNHKYLTSYEILKYDDCKITLLESSDFVSKEDLRKLEGQYIRNNKCVNIRIEGRSQKEYYQDNKKELNEYNKEYRDKNKEKIKEYKKEYYDKNKEQQKEYYQKNKEQIKEYKKEYNDKNKEQLNEYKKEYREKNKEKIKDYQKKYREQNKENRNKKIVCDCGGSYSLCTKARHKKTKKHQKYINSLN